MQVLFDAQVASGDGRIWKKEKANEAQGKQIFGVW
jgi:hypothetical protein